MPNSSLHISFARDAAKLLGHPAIDGRMGSYLLGSTAPDVRNLAGWDRYKTHFFDLVSGDPGRGIEGLFKHYPELAEAANLSKETKAFVLGYMSHLVTDETWICRVYRPFFGRSSPLADDPMGNVMDRVLQFDLDRIERNRVEDIEEVLSLLRESDRGVRVGFIGQDLLQRWRDIIYERTSRELPWGHLRGFARKALPDDLKHDDEVLDKIVESAPAILDRAKASVLPQALDEFRDNAISEFVTIAGEYLD